MQTLHPKRLSPQEKRSQTSVNGPKMRKGDRVLADTMTAISPSHQFSSHSHTTPSNPNPNLTEIEKIERMSPLELGIRAVQNHIGPHYRKKRKLEHPQPLEACETSIDGNKSTGIGKQAGLLSSQPLQDENKIKSVIEPEFITIEDMTHGTIQQGFGGKMVTRDKLNHSESDSDTEAPEIVTLSDGKADADQRVKTLMGIKKLKKDEQKKKWRMREAKHKENKEISLSQKAFISEENTLNSPLKESHFNRDLTSNITSGSEDELDLLVSTKNSPSSRRKPLPYRLPDSVLAPADKSIATETQVSNNAHKRFGSHDSDELTMQTKKSKQRTKSKTNLTRDIGPVQVLVLERVSNKIPPKAQSKSLKDQTMFKKNTLRKMITVPKGLAKK
ncbi:hypothetical protein NEOLI_001705 [Neolecta irregularis DAH-3]|uniref:Uncharacterized protein n=1 Tax=Neolecta irregularis (strain DAH-3) TaxID=1198029 RepID=A0A1U7LJL4_NEOID|nr:hypothetical protein NEOLI_001705 [Neolecta irregularis DAH-3]|eukprot:OLL22837.1 hypothetical protein NEOLI_001705 [Neolecta irregularis DAH-3]